MARPNAVRAAERFVQMANRIAYGLELQKNRIEERARGEQVIPGDGFEVIVIEPMGLDLDYYVFELSRLSNAADSALKVFERARINDAAVESTFPKLRDHIAALKGAVPGLKNIRDPLLHPNNDDKLDNILFMTSIVRARPDGQITSLVDALGHQHEAALALLQALRCTCRTIIKRAIEDDPPRSLDHQIKAREQADGVTVAVPWPQ